MVLFSREISTFEKNPTAPTLHLGMDSAENDAFRPNTDFG